MLCPCSHLAPLLPPPLLVPLHHVLHARVGLPPCLCLQLLRGDEPAGSVLLSVVQ